MFWRPHDFAPKTQAVDLHAVDGDSFLVTIHDRHHWLRCRKIVQRPLLCVNKKTVRRPVRTR
jgi:hypothetical protein